MLPKPLKKVLIAVWIAAGFAVCGVSAAAWLMRDTAGGRRITPNGVVGDSQGTSLKPLFQTPKFSLRDQNGKPFKSTDLAGNVWVADFIFTHCTSMCPLMTQNMRDVQAATAGMPVQMVSFTVDPQNDTPAVLKQYAEANRADLSRWHFVTGGQKTVWDLTPGMRLAGWAFFSPPGNPMWDLSVGMKLAVGDGDTPMQVMHSSRFLLVDGHGAVRGTYDYKDAGAIQTLLTDVRALVNSGDK